MSKWYFGVYSALDFSANPPAILANSSMSVAEGCSSIADASGNLLFYTDGATVWDKTHSTMANGTSLWGVGNPCQGTIIVRQPGSANLYYIFINGSNSTYGFNYSVVDMSLAAGQGSVTVKNVYVHVFPYSEKITATRHANGVDYWIVLNGMTSNSPNYNFQSFLFTSAGLNFSPVISLFTGSSANELGYGCMKISPNGQKLACAYNANFLTQRNFNLYDFNNSTGVVSNDVVLNSTSSSTVSENGYGVEFSPDGTKLYGSSYKWGSTINSISDTGYIYQWDLCAGSGASIAASKQTLYRATVQLGSLQRAINGKIYLARRSTNFLGVINNPDNAGIACNYIDQGQGPITGYDWYSLPNFINSDFLPQPVTPPFTYTAGNNSGCQGAQFTGPPAAGNMTQVACTSTGFSITAYHWNFGDPLSGAANTSTLSNPAHGFTSLGTYTTQLIVYYSNGGPTDTLKQVVTINQSCITFSSSVITCASLGSATATPASGLGPYTYTWMPGALSGSVVTGLIPGTYTVTFQDPISNISATSSITFTPVIPLTGSVSSSSSVTCNGASTGTAAIINLSGGSGTQTYLWTNGSQIYATGSPQNLSAGVWSVTVTDALTACQVKETFTITEPLPLGLTLSASAPSVCQGGEIVLTGTNSGGTAGYTYTWTGGPALNTYTVNESTAGTYVYTLSSTDANTCLTSHTIAVDFVPNPVLSVSGISICPLSAGTLTVSGASSYTWSTGTTGSFMTDSPVMSKIYSVTGSALGCTSTANSYIILKAVPIVYLNSNSPRCEGTSLLLQGSAGASYSWNGPNGFISSVQNPNISSLSLNQAGTYSLVVTAANSCTAQTTKTIVVNPSPTLTVTGSTLCSSQTLNLSASANATAYLWTGPQNFTSTLQAPTVANPGLTSSGTYTLKITDAFGCINTGTASVNIVSPPSLTTSLSGNGTLCAQALNGSANTITLTSGGAASYSLVTPHHISNPNPSGPVSPLSSLPPYNSGVATATLFGSNGVCTVSASIDFSVIPNPTVTINSPTPVICAGQSFTYTNQGASSYTWGPGSPNLNTYTGPVTVASPTVTAIYSVVGASLGCNSSTQTSTITVNPLPTLSIIPEIPKVCLNEKIVLSALGNATSYNWSPSTNLSSMNGASVSAGPTIMQSYTVTGSLNSCTNSAMITVSVLPLPKPLASISSPSLCLNEQVTLQGSGGVSYEWKGPSDLSLSGQTATFNAVNSSYSGTYTLTVSDKNSCKASAQTELLVYNLPGGTLQGTKMQGCVPFKSDFNFQSTSTSTISQVTTEWHIGNKIFTGNTFSSEFKVPGNYMLTGYYTDVLTSCVNTKTFVVEAYSLPVADFSFLPEKPIENLEEVIFTNTSKGEDQTKWSWHFINNKGYRSENKNTSYLFTEAGIYPVAMIVNNNKGCADTIVKTIKIEADLAVYVPNIFTPNEDGRNDIFLPITRAIKSYELLVFDRWGAKVFSSTSIENGWDGSFRSEPCKSDVYIWKIYLTSVNGEMKTLTGHVTLNR